MKTGIIIPVFNRPAYLQECLEYLFAADGSAEAQVVIVDDASTDERLYRVFSFAKSAGCDIIRHERNTGITGSIKTGADHLFKNGKCDVIMVLDNDVVVKPEFLTKMLSLFIYNDCRVMVSGINCEMPDPATGKLRNPLISAHEGYALKEAVAGQCLMFNQTMYNSWVLPALNKVGNWDHNASINSMADNSPIAVCIPSVCQHMGMYSSMGHNHQEPDRADDFKFLQLPDVTLFGIDSHDIAGIERAAAISQRDIEFGNVNIITNNLFTATEHEARRKEYSRFMLKELTNYFTTSHVLTIHADGYVLNWKAWEPKFLQYDYIGATWAYKDNMNVGNGGFSLRSKKLCDILAANHIEESLMHPEDGCICRTYRKSLEDNFGIKFAPEEVANRFSIEAYGTNGFIPPANLYNDQFGFHGKHVDFLNSNLPSFLRYPYGQYRQPLKRNIQTWDRPKQL